MENSEFTALIGGKVVLYKYASKRRTKGDDYFAAAKGLSYLGKGVINSCGPHGARTPNLELHFWA